MLPAKSSAIALACATLFAVPALAQAPAPKSESATPMASNQSNLQAKPKFMPSGMMMGPRTISADEMDRSCDPRSAGFSGWRVADFERGLDLTEPQKTKLDDFKAASAKALDKLVTSCPHAAPLTPTGRLEMMETRLTALLEAVKSMRTAFEPFYASLNDEQKARLTADSHGRGWRWQTAGGHQRR
jgi:hypothetical protein